MWRNRMFLNGAVIALDSTNGNDGGGAGTGGEGTGAGTGGEGTGAGTGGEGTGTGGEGTGKPGEEKPAAGSEGMVSKEQVNQLIKEALLSKDQEINGLKSLIEANKASKETQDQTVEEKVASAEAREKAANMKILNAHRDSEAANAGIPKYLTDQIGVTENDSEETVSTKVAAFRTKLETFLNEKVEEMKTKKLIITSGDTKQEGPKPGALGESLANTNTSPMSGLAGNFFGIKN